MRAYILGVCGAVILSAFLLLLLPGGKLGKFIGGVLKLFCVAVILLPIPQLLRDFDIGGGVASSASMNLDESFIASMFERRAREQEEELVALFAEDPGIGVAADVAWEAESYAYRVTGVSVRIEDFGIYGEDRHIFVIEQVESRLGKLFDESVEVSVYE